MNMNDKGLCKECGNSSEVCDCDRIDEYVKSHPIYKYKLKKNKILDVIELQKRKETAKERGKIFRRKHKLIHLSKCYRRKGIDLSPTDLRRMLKKQKMMCALTGEKLTNDNISLDHIVPRIRGGNHDKNNLRLVTRESNTFKRARSDEELLKICKKILDCLGASK